MSQEQYLFGNMWPRKARQCNAWGMRSCSGQMGQLAAGKKQLQQAKHNQEPAMVLERSRAAASSRTSLPLALQTQRLPPVPVPSGSPTAWPDASVTAFMSVPPLPWTSVTPNVPALDSPVPFALTITPASAQGGQTHNRIHGTHAFAGGCHPPVQCNCAVVQQSPAGQPGLGSKQRAASCLTRQGSKAGPSKCWQRLT